MDALMGLRTWKWRATDWAAAAVSGFAAGAVLMVLDLVYTSIFNPDGPWRISHMIAPIFTGADSVPTSRFEFDLGVVTIALATHYVVGIIFGVVIAAILTQLEFDSLPGHALVVGAVLGVVLYLIIFELMVGFFPWLSALRGGDTIAAHVVFGIVTALLYWKLKRPAVER